MTERVVRKPSRDHSTDSGLSSPGSNSEMQIGTDNGFERKLTRHMSMSRDRAGFRSSKRYSSICDLQDEAQTVQSLVSDLTSTGTMRRRRTASAGLSIAARKQLAKESISSYTPVAPSESVWGQKFDDMMARLRGSRLSADVQDTHADKDCTMSTLRERDEDPDSTIQTNTSICPEITSQQTLQLVDLNEHGKTTHSSASDSNNKTDTTELLNTDTDELLNTDTDELLNTDTDELLNTDTAELLNTDTAELLNTDTDELLNINTDELLNTDTAELLNTDTAELLSTDSINNNTIEKSPPEDYELSNSLKDIITFSEDSYSGVVEEEVIDQHQTLLCHQPIAQSVEIIRKADEVDYFEKDRMCRSMTTDGLDSEFKSSQLKNLLRSISFHRPDLSTYDVSTHRLRRTDSSK